MFSRGEGGEVGWGTDVAVGSPAFFNALVGKPCLFQIPVGLGGPGLDQGTPQGG